MIALSVVRGFNWQQESYETASRDAGQRSRELRKLGFKVSTAPLGPQVTKFGLLKLTLVTISDLPSDAQIPSVMKL